MRGNLHDVKLIPDMLPLLMLLVSCAATSSSGDTTHGAAAQPETDEVIISPPADQDVPIADAQGHLAAWAVACASDEDCVALVACICGSCPGTEPAMVNHRAAEQYRQQCEREPAAPRPCSPCPPPADPVPYYQPACRDGACEAERCDDHCRPTP